MGVLLLLASCTFEAENFPASSEYQEEVTEPALQTIVLAEQKRTEYVIYVSAGEVRAVSLAWRLRSIIRELCGVGPSVVLLKEEEVPASGCRILVGALAKEICADPEEGGYVLTASDETIGIRSADDLGDIALENDLRCRLLYCDEAGTLEISRQSVSGRLAGTLKNQPDATFHFVYDPKDEGSARITYLLAMGFQNECGYRAQVHGVDGDYPNRVYIGDVDASAVELVKSRVSPGEYFLGVVGDAIVMSGDSDLGYFFALEKLVECFAQLHEGVEEVLLEGVLQNYADAPRDESYAKTIAFANRLSATYSSHAEKKIAEAAPADKADHELVNALKKRMGNSLIVQANNNLGLHDGYAHRLDPLDHTAVAKYENGCFLVPRSYAEVYFGTTLPVDEKGYVDLASYCSTAEGYTFEYHSTSGLGFVLPQGVISFLDLTKRVDGYSNGEYLARLKRFLNNPYLPEPQNSVEATRVVVGQVDPHVNPKYFYHYVYGENEDGMQGLYSPAIVAVKENGKTVLYVSHEHAYLGTEARRSVFLKRSEDDGKTWITVDEYPSLLHQSIFASNGKIYTIGTSGGRVFVAEYDPSTGASRSQKMGAAVGSGSSNTVLIAKGRVYRCFNHAIASASVEADLLLESSWRFSNNPNEYLTKDRYIRITGETPTSDNFRIEEGNMVMSPDGQIYAMYRIDAAPSHKTAFVFEVSDDGKTVTPIAEREGIVAFPSSQTKFSLIYDAELELYITITSLPTHNTVTMQRNCLGFLVSKDLVHWEVIDSLLVDRQMVNDKYSYWAHGFQYVDFSIMDETLYFFVRESSGESVNFHDANYATLYTIENFRDFVRERLS